MVNKRHTWITVKIAVKQNQPAPTSAQCWDLFPSTWCMEFLSHYTHKLVFYYFQSVSTTLWVPGVRKSGVGETNPLSNIFRSNYRTWIELLQSNYIMSVRSIHRREISYLAVVIDRRLNGDRQCCPDEWPLRLNLSRRTPMTTSHGSTYTDKWPFWSTVEI